MTAILLAAGNGQRAGNSKKQFLRIHQKPLLAYSLEVLLKSKFIRDIVVVIPRDSKKTAEKILLTYKSTNKKGIFLIEGGKQRKDSAYNGLRFIEKKIPKTDYVIFHDAVRPLISQRMVTAVIVAAQKYGAATVGIPAIDLLFTVQDGLIKNAINKAPFYYGFTPQVFKFRNILQAHRKAEKKFPGDADNIEILKQTSKSAPVKILEGFYPNIKLTYQSDIALLRFLLNYGRK